MLGPLLLTMFFAGGIGVLRIPNVRAPQQRRARHEQVCSVGQHDVLLRVTRCSSLPSVDCDSSEYHSNQALRVLVATRTGSGDGYGQQAFFFVNGRYIGTDAKDPSAKLRVVSQSDTEVTLAYPLYRKNDALCCPGGGQATVRFQLNNGRLSALDPIPPVERANGLSRQ